MLRRPAKGHELHHVNHRLNQYLCSVLFSFIILCYIGIIMFESTLSVIPYMSVINVFFSPFIRENVHLYCSVRAAHFSLILFISRVDDECHNEALLLIYWSCCQRQKVTLNFSALATEQWQNALQGEFVHLIQSHYWVQICQVLHD